MTKDQRTVSVYDKWAEDYAKMVEADEPNPRLDNFIAALPPGGHVLDLGCGPGTWAARMIARGLTVDAVDASAGMAEVARARYGLEIRTAGFEDVTGENLYDGIWAHFSLLHAPRDAMPGHLDRLARALRPGGVFLIGIKLGTGEWRDSRDRFYTSYTQQELEGLLNEAGYRIEERETGEAVGFDDKLHPFLVLLARLL